MPISMICPVCGTGFQADKWRLTTRKIQSSSPCCSRSCAAKFRSPCSLTHGHSINRARTKEHQAWTAMKKRCYYKTSKDYPRYGGRGIRVCDRWRDSFQNFLDDVGYAPSPEHSMGRIHNDGDYEPGNAEWQLPCTQANNKSTNRLLTAFGRTQTLQQWADERKIHHTTILTRINKQGWPLEKALSIDPSINRKRFTKLTF